MPPVTGRRPASGAIGVVISVADFREEEEMLAQGAARIRVVGRVVVAVEWVNGGFLSWRWGMKLPRSALGGAERRANMLKEEELN
jgi:hypothetical protein